MDQDRDRITPAPNDNEPPGESIAGTGPGVADDALAPGEEPFEAPGDDEVERVARKLGSTDKERDTLPLDGE